jgi:hypothetical protein
MEAFGPNSMSVQFQTPIEALTESFEGATAELSLEQRLNSEEIVAPNSTVNNIANQLKIGVLTYRDHVKPNQSHFVSTKDNVLTPVKQVQLMGIMKEVGEKFRDWRTSFRDSMSHADDKLRALAAEVQQKAKEFGVSIEEYLRRMQRQFYAWALANSAVDFFSVGSDEKVVTFAPDKITSTGKFQFGPIGSSITSIDDIVGVLKIIPSISVEVDVEYKSKTASKAKKKSS